MTHQSTTGSGVAIHVLLRHVLPMWIGGASMHCNQCVAIHVLLSQKNGSDKIQYVCGLVIVAGINQKGQDTLSI